MNTRKENEFLNGVPELLILRLLDRQPMYGYQLVQAIKLTTGDVLAFGEGSIYPVLHRLEATGLLVANRQEVSGRSRVTYRLSDSGRARLDQVASRWQQIVSAVHQVLKGEHDGEPAVA